MSESKSRGKPSQTAVRPKLPSYKCIDIGANLLDDMFSGRYHGKRYHEKDLNQVLEKAKAIGMEKIIVTAGTLQEARHALKLVADDPALYTTVGVHPTRAKEFEKDGKEGKKYLEDLLALAQEGKKSGKVVAIGECGLDYDRLHFTPKDIQLKHFDKHFVLTEATGLPMFLHSRNDYPDFVKIMKENRHRFKDGVVHSYTGVEQELKDLLALDLYIGLNGVSFRTEENVRVAAMVPLDRLMIETDAPWCEVKATHPCFKYVKSKWDTKKKENYVPSVETTVKGRNEPCHIIQVLEILSVLHKKPIEEIADIAYRNTLKVFFPAEYAKLPTQQTAP